VQKSVRFTTTFEFERKYLEAMKIATICKWRWRKRSFGRWTKKIWGNSVHYKQNHKRSCWPSNDAVLHKDVPFWG